MAIFWMIGSSLPSMQCLIELGEAKPSRFDFINNHSINVFRDKLLMEHRGEDEAERERLEFDGMPTPVFEIADPDFALDYFFSGIPCASAKLRQALDLSDDVIRYRDIDLDRSPPSVRARAYQTFHVAHFADAIDWERTPMQILELPRDDGTILKRRFVRPPHPAEPDSRIYWRKDFAPPAPLFHVVGTPWMMATDALADRVMRAGINDMTFQDIVSERGQSDYVLRQL